MRRRALCATGCRRSARRSRTSSPSPGTRATSPWASIPTASRARSSSAWPRKDRRCRGLMDAFATSISLALQHGVPLKVLCEKFAHTRFEPSGWTGNEQIGYAKSLMDYIFRWLNLRFLSGAAVDAVCGAGSAGAATAGVAQPDAGERAGGGCSRRLRSSTLARLAEEVAKRLNQVSGSGHSAADVRSRGRRHCAGGASRMRRRRRRARAGAEHAGPRAVSRGRCHARACTTWATRRAAERAARSWCATGAATAA